MKKLNQLAIFVLAATVAGLAQPQTTATTADPAGQTTTPAQPAQPQQKKEIKDPAEYNAYVTALGLGDANAKATALEQFVQQYPNSVVKEDALEQEMGAYQQANNLQKAADAANRVLQINSNNVRALLVLAFTGRAAAEQGNAQAAAQALQYGQRGLQALPAFAKPEGMTDEQYKQLKSVMEIVFNGAAGRGALNAKDYPNAQKYFQAAVDAQVAANPNDPSLLQNVYPLAVAYLSPKPIDLRGLFYVARAVNLSKGNADIVKYGKVKYHNYHGEDEGDKGWNQLVVLAANSPAPSANFSVAPAPTPAEQVAALVAKTDPKKMDFGEWQLVFTYGDQPTVDKVWSAIKSVPLQFEATVIDAPDKEHLLLAATADAIEQNKADVEVTMAGPIPATMKPKVGSSIKLQAQPMSYDKGPYLMHLDTGKLLTKPAHATPKHPVRRRK